MATRIRIRSSFVHGTKTEPAVQFLSDFKEGNKGIMRNLFLIPKISTVLQKFEGFTNAKALDLNIGCFNIRLDPDYPRYALFSIAGHSYL